MWWCSVTMFPIPTSLIFLTWAVMAHHFATENENRQKTNNQEKRKILELISHATKIFFSNLKWVTIKMASLTGLFLLTFCPYCLVFINWYWYWHCLVFLNATIYSPISTTEWLDRSWLWRLSWSWFWSWL